MDQSDQQKQIEELKQQLALAKKLIQREVGPDADVEKLMQDESSWKGRAEQIQGLRVHIRELQGHSPPPLTRKDSAHRRVTELVKSERSLHDEVQLLRHEQCDIARVYHLSDFQEEDFEEYKSPLLGNGKYRSVFGGEGFLPLEAFIYRGTYILGQCVYDMFDSNQNAAKKWLRGGPRKHLYFQSNKVKAAIVTCGGLCPGLNVVIRELVMSLHYNYKAQEIYGIKYGYRGFYLYDWEKLTPEKVKSIHWQGGTMLGSSRGGFDLEKIVNKIVEMGINQLYCLGGDGTHRGMLELAKEFRKRKLQIAISGIPKTIDNDIPIIDDSFGFETAVQEAQTAIHSAWVEANCAEFGVGLVRLMGRHAGFIAMEACNASREVNICLVPEFKFDLFGKYGVLEYAFQRLKSKGRLVIVCAEGSGEAVQDYKVSIDSVDQSGNVKTEDIGLILKKELTKFCKSNGMEITLKYIDPTYMIRTTEANPHDRNMCAQLAQNAVHGAMAGFTGFTVGHVNRKICYIPIDELLSGKYANKITPNSRRWQRLLMSTGQPSFLNDEATFMTKYGFN